MKDQWWSSLEEILGKDWMPSVNSKVLEKLELGRRREGIQAQGHPARKRIPLRGLLWPPSLGNRNQPATPADFVSISIILYTVLLGELLTTGHTSNSQSAGFLEGPLSSVALQENSLSPLWGPPSRSETPRSPSHTSTPSPKHRTPGSAWSPPCRRLSCQDTQTSQLPGHFSLFHSPPSPVFSTPSWRKISAGEQQAWPPKPSGRGSFVPLCTRASRWS